MFEPIFVELPKFVKVSSLEFVDIVDRNCVNIMFISDLRDITLSHYMDQPSSMIFMKLERKFIEEDFGDFVYNWLPHCFRQTKRIFF